MLIMNYCMQQSQYHSKISFIASKNEFQTNHKLSIHLNWNNAKEWIQTLIINIISSIHDDVMQRYTMALENGIAAHNGPLEGFHLHHLSSHIRPLWSHSRENIPKGSTSIYTLLQGEHSVLSEPISKKSIKMTHIWTSKPISSLIQIERWKKGPLTYLYFQTTLFWIQNRKSSELMLNRRQLWIFIQQAVKSKIIWIVLQVLQNWLHSKLWGSWENSQSFLLRFIRIRRIWGKV